MLKPRHEALLEALPRHNNKVLPSAIEAGYSRTYAEKRGKVLYKNAIKAKVKDIAERLEDNEITAKEANQSMSNIVGMSKEETMELLRKIANNDKDYGSALKVIRPIAKEMGFIMEEDQAKTIVPVLNIGVREIQPNTVIENGTSTSNPLIVESNREDIDAI